MRQLSDRRALVGSENARPLIAQLRRYIDGSRGKALLEAQRAARDRVTTAQRSNLSVTARTQEAVATAPSDGIAPRRGDGTHDEQERLVCDEITWEFPLPTNALATAFADLQIARSDDERAKKALGPLTALARPRDPPTCPPSLRSGL